MLRAALWNAQGLRKDSVFVAVLEGPPNAPLSLTFKGKELECYLLNEFESVECIRRCMKGELKGCKVERKDLGEVLRSIGVPIVLLSEDGKDIDEVKIPKSFAVVLGSQHDVELPSDIEISLKVSVGPRSYLASHCISFLHYKLDATMGSEPRQRLS
ncbi:hypothetical protein IPA_00025 [Ignicoccus pacificus DSM 13166]|uniref:tRNA (pseudouridine(54)-N(1))-methyltransferase n=1 Tax=Ignicoccus pacificus DSM 13166 TaxID=940294 RepID=A0A977KA96_9CREN|nr:hypothetical protein IPA_00025 [Ignicoccus pacificus DSM 13166]